MTSPGSKAAQLPSDALSSEGADSDQPETAGNCVQELYLNHQPALVRKLVAWSRCPELARDLAQDAFVNVLRLAPAALARIRRPDAFLGRVGTNLLRDRARSRAAAERALAAVEASADRCFDQIAVLEARDTLRRLEQAIGRMRPKTRAIFLDHRIHGLSYAEIAGRTGLSVKGVEKQMAKAIAKIDRLLDRE
jgi:RNA polymerase sigma factor (sigma-70 family)